MLIWGPGRVSEWGVLGHGTGDLALEPDGSGVWKTDTSMAMASVGARGVLLPAKNPGGSSSGFAPTRPSYGWSRTRHGARGASSPRRTRRRARSGCLSEARGASRSKAERRSARRSSSGFAVTMVRFGQVTSTVISFRSFPGSSVQWVAGPRALPSGRVTPMGHGPSSRFPTSSLREPQPPEVHAGRPAHRGEGVGRERAGVVARPLAGVQGEALGASPEETVRVDFETVDGTAKAGEDYEAVSGALTIPKGETGRSVWVRVLDDEHAEMMTLVLSNPVNATLADSTAIGPITRVTATVPMPTGRRGARLGVLGVGSGGGCDTGGGQRRKQCVTRSGLSTTSNSCTSGDRKQQRPRKTARPPSDSLTNSDGSSLPMPARVRA